MNENNETHKPAERTSSEQLFWISTELDSLATVARLARTEFDGDGEVARTLDLFERECERISSAICNVPVPDSEPGSQPDRDPHGETEWQIGEVLADIKATTTLMAGAATSHDLQLGEDTVIQTCNRIEKDCERIGDLVGALTERAKQQGKGGAS